MRKLPISIMVGGKEYRIQNDGDFDVVRDCIQALNDYDLDEGTRILTALIIFLKDLNYDNIAEILPNEETFIEAAEELFKFINCGSDSFGAKVNYKVIDWDKDEQMIFSAMNAVANTELRAVPYLHWWTAMGYFSSIPSETLFGTVVSIRNKIVKGKKKEKYEIEFIRDNPQYFNWDKRTESQKQQEDEIRRLWNSDRKEGDL